MRRKLVLVLGMLIAMCCVSLNTPQAEAGWRGGYGGYYRGGGYGYRGGWGGYYGGYRGGYYSGWRRPYVYGGYYGRPYYGGYYYY